MRASAQYVRCRRRHLLSSSAPDSQVDFDTSGCLGIARKDEQVVKATDEFMSPKVDGVDKDKETSFTEALRKSCSKLKDSLRAILTSGVEPNASDSMQTDKENLPPNNGHSITTEEVERVRLNQQKRDADKMASKGSVKKMKIQVSPVCKSSKLRQSYMSTVGILRRSKKADNSSADVYVTETQMKWFLRLIENPVVSGFLEADICHRYADNYLLAMVFAYFVRAKFAERDYSKENFFAALYLAHDMEEDDEDLKFEVFPWALGQRWRKRCSSVLLTRDDIFWRINCRAAVSKKCCDQVMNITPNHWIWARVRPEYHGGALRDYLRHEDDKGSPRGPFMSPLRCLKCLEKSCVDSSNSYLLYMSESESSVDEAFFNNGETTEHKDSGYETILCGSGKDLNATMTSARRPSTRGTSFILKSHQSSATGESSASSLYDIESLLCDEDCYTCTTVEKVSVSQADTVVLSKHSQEL